MSDSYINILGKTIGLVKRPTDKLKGINMGEKLTFDFFDGLFRGVKLLFVKPKGGNPTPKKCAIVSERLIVPCPLCAEPWHIQSEVLQS